MTAGLLLKRMNGAPRGGRSGNGMPPDNWIYIQEPDVRIGRLQVFNNWSPALGGRIRIRYGLGLEYFCRQNDDLWSMADGAFIDFAASELEKIGLIDRRDVLDGTLVRVPKAYPAYFGSYGEFEVLRAYLDRFHNIYPVGRNGMHRYNNQDHSMLAANAAVSAIIGGVGQARHLARQCRRGVPRGGGRGGHDDTMRACPNPPYWSSTTSRTSANFCPSRCNEWTWIPAPRAAWRRRSVFSRPKTSSCA